MISLINNFDGEFEFVTKLSDNGAVDKIILNIVKKRDDLGKNGIGSTREDVELVYGKNVKGIERTYNFEFFNASKVTGKDGINWNSSEFSYVNSDGVEEFYKKKTKILHLHHYPLKNILLTLEKTHQIYGLEKILKQNIPLLLKCGAILSNNLSHMLILKSPIK
ncbi:hypothetical protein KF7HA_02349 [Lactococcus lactis]|nr:hypothetical protein [Lactococcus lactis]